MAILDQVTADAQSALRAGDRDRVRALRLVLSELQKAAKEGATTRWRCCAASASAGSSRRAAFRDAGRDELAGGEEAEAELIGAYLPAELSEEELEAIVAQAVRESGASRAGHGQAMTTRWRPSTGAPRASGRLGARAGVAAGMRTQIELPTK